MAYVGWRMWCERYPISLALVREFLSTIAAGWDATFLEIFTTDPDAIRADIGRLPEASLENRFARGIRKRTGKQGFATFVETVLGILRGNDFAEVGPEQRALVTKGFGLSQARTDHFAGERLLGDPDELLSMVGDLR